MSVLLALAGTGLAIAVLAAIAEERILAYRLEHTPIDVRAVLIAAFVTLARGWLASRRIGGLDTSVAFAIAAVAAMTDLRCGYVFDRVLLTGGIAIIALEATHGTLGAAMAGGAAAACTMTVPWALSRARGMGFGDVKLAGVLGCVLGPTGAMLALWFAFVVGAVVAVACIVIRRGTRERAVPFAPFLAIGAVLSTGSAAW